MNRVIKNTTNLKITASSKIKHDIDYYFGKSFKVKTIITDVMGDRYESEIIMQPSYGRKEFEAAQTIAFTFCDAMPVAIHLEEFILLD